MLSKKIKFMGLIFSLIFLAFLEYVITHNAETLPQIHQLITHTSLPIAGGLFTLSLCSLLGSIPEGENPATSHLFRRFSEYPARNFFAGFLVTAYLNLVRPSLAANVSFLPYIEWVTIALTVYAMYSMTRISTKQFYVGSEALSWKRHIQEVTRETGHDLMRVTSVMETFLDQGVKEPLLVYLSLHLQKLGKTEEEILKALSPFIDYHENPRRHKLYFFASPWTKRRLAVKNKKARESLLSALLEKIDGLRLE